MMIDWKEKCKALKGFLYPFLLLLLGILFMLVPSGSKREKTPTDESVLLSQLLSECRDIGDARVLISESGVIVACEGASRASVRLDILHAVYSYTGFGSDKITILQLTHGA